MVALGRLKTDTNNGVLHSAKLFTLKKHPLLILLMEELHSLNIKSNGYFLDLVLINNTSRYF